MSSLVFRKRRQNVISNGSNILLNVVFIIVSVCCVAPLLLVIAISVSDEAAIRANGYQFWPQAFSSKGYDYLMTAGDAIWRAYGVSVLVTIVGTFLSLAVITMYAYPLSRSAFKYRSQFSFFAFFTMIFGGGLVPWYIVYTQLIPIKNTLWIMIVPYLMNTWYMMIMRTFYKTTVPESIIESARIDGAGEFRTYFVIVLPLCKAGLATVGLFCTLSYWNDFYLPLVFVTNNKNFNIQYLMYQTLIAVQNLMNSSNQISNSNQILANLPAESVRMAIAVISIGPIVLAYPFFQKYFVKGLTIGAVKG